MDVFAWRSNRQSPGVGGHPVGKRPGTVRHSLCRGLALLLLLAAGCGRKAPDAPPELTGGTPAPGGTDSPAAPVEAIGGPDVSWLADDVEVLVQIRVGEMLKSPLLTSLAEAGMPFLETPLDADLDLTLRDIELVTIAGRKLSDLDAAAVQQGPSGLDPARHFLMGVIRLSRPLERSRLETDAEMQPAQHAGQAYYRRDANSPGDPDIAVYMPDDTTLVIGAEPEIKAALERGPGVSRSARFSYMDGSAHLVVTVALQDLAAVRSAPLPDDVPAVWGDAVRAVQQHGERFGLQLSLTEGAHLALRAHCRSAAGAAEVAERLTLVTHMLQSLVEQNQQNLMFLMGVVGPLVNNLSGTAEGPVVQFATELPPEAGRMLAGFAPMLGMMLGAGMGHMMTGPDFPGSGGMPFGGGRIEELLASAQPASALDGLGDDVALSAAVTWGPGEFLAYGGDVEPPPVLRTFLFARGGEAARAIAYGHVKLSAAATDAGRLKQTNPDVMVDSARGLTLIDRQDPWAPMPADGVMIPLAFSHPLDHATAIQDLSGTFQLRVSGQQSPKLIKDLKALIGNPVDDADLQAAGFTVDIQESQFEGAPEAIVIRVHPTAVLGDLEVLNNRGMPADELWTDQQLLPDGSSRYRLTSGVLEKLPEALQLRFTLHTEMTDVTAAFRFEDLPLPPLDEPVSEKQKLLVAWSPSTVSEGLPEGLFVEGRSGWSTSINFDSSGNAQPRALEVVLDLTGSLPLKTIALGRYEVNAARAGTEELAVNADGFGVFQNALQELLLYDPLLFAPSLPADGIRFSIEFQAPGTPPARLDEVSGRMTLVTAASQRFIVVPNVLESVGKELEHPELRGAGVTLSPVKEGDSITVRLTADNRFAVTAIEAIDPSGAELLNIYGGRGDFNGRVEFSLLAEDEFPERMGLRITLNAGVEEHVIPFRFENLPVPAPPATE